MKPVERGEQRLNSYELVAYSRPQSFTTESFRTLRTNLQFLGVGDSLKTVLIAGSGFGEGASFITANLGIVFAQAGQRVIIVDCDLRKPRQHLIFNLDNQLGLTSVLSGFKEPEQVIKDIPIAGVRLLTAGLLPTNPAELLGSREMSRLVSALKEKADVILLDGSPLTVFADAAILSKSVDGVLMVVRSRVASQNSVTNTRELLTNAKASILGVALNCARMDALKDDYQAYYANAAGVPRQKKKKAEKPRKAEEKKQAK
ncbi:MAG TPA: capsular biosynthesis protein [Pelotomaculum sp.]|nr:capsular biosynthesis protein [Pelotomaculum sp.]